MYSKNKKNIVTALVLLLGMMGIIYSGCAMKGNRSNPNNTHHDTGKSKKLPVIVPPPDNPQTEEPPVIVLPSDDPLTEDEMKRLLNGTIWKSSKDNFYFEYLTETTGKRVQTDGGYDRETLPFTFDVQDVKYDGKSGKPYWVLVRRYRYNDMTYNHVFYFTEATETSLGSVYYEEPTKDDDGYYIIGTGKRIDKVNAIP